MAAPDSSIEAELRSLCESRPTGILRDAEGFIDRRTTEMFAK